MNKINHRMIQLARESRGYSQTELAELIDVPQGNLSRMERGDIGIKLEHLEKLCTILNYPIAFFYTNKQIATTDTHYRKALTIDQKTKLKAEALMNIYKFNVEEMLQSLDIENNVPIITDDEISPEKVAKYLRGYWGLAKGSIDNLSDVIEKNGVIIIQIDFETDKIDGRTLVTETGHPIIFINKSASGDRQRFTLAHELGHVVLHINRMSNFVRDEEDEAFAFASEFLMPFSECQYDLNDKISIEKLADLKRIWKISMQAILYRGQKSKLISYNRCRYIWSMINAKGWKKREPIDIPKETPTLIDRMIKVFINDLEYSREDLSKILNLNRNELDERYFSKTTNKLRIV